MSKNKLFFATTFCYLLFFNSIVSLSLTAFFAPVTLMMGSLLLVFFLPKIFTKNSINISKKKFIKWTIFLIFISWIIPIFLSETIEKKMFFLKFLEWGNIFKWSHFLIDPRFKAWDEHLQLFSVQICLASSTVIVLSPIAFVIYNKRFATGYFIIMFVLSSLWPVGLMISVPALFFYYPWMLRLAARARKKLGISEDNFSPVKHSEHYYLVKKTLIVLFYIIVLTLVGMALLER